MKTKISRIIGQLATCAALMAVPAYGQTTNPNEGASHYANVRGWSVYTMGDGRGLFSCRAVRGQGYNNQIMIEYNMFDEDWSVLVHATRPTGGGLGITGAVVYYDGRLADSQVHFGISGDDGASDSHAKLILTNRQLGRVKAGNTIRIDINGESSRTWSLSGTTAAVKKVAECAGLSVAAAAPAPAQASPTPQAVVDGHSVGYVVYATGQFTHTGFGQWVEETDTGAVFYYAETSRDNGAVILNDASRNVQIWLGLTHHEISYTEDHNENAWRLLYPIECFDRKASRSC